VKLLALIALFVSVPAFADSVLDGYHRAPNSARLKDALNSGRVVTQGRVEIPGYDDFAEQKNIVDSFKDGNYYITKFLFFQEGQIADSTSQVFPWEGVPSLDPSKPYCIARLLYYSVVLHAIGHDVRTYTISNYDGYGQPGEFVIFKSDAFEVNGSRPLRARGPVYINSSGSDYGTGALKAESLTASFFYDPAAVRERAPRFDSLTCAKLGTPASQLTVGDFSSAMGSAYQVWSH
jgi:hypothetical protein